MDGIKTDFKTGKKKEHTKKEKDPKDPQSQKKEKG
ncbi:MAG: hypothetical protein Ct9H90mP6_09850 [Gammaproteobacteria bacterium]|nr:MAG: hypothetical protein Ct9H90mP6_09850 [Gammaproteobacteria bacterium]